MRKKTNKEEHGNLDRWLLTYADMITLLMAFFIMMYSMSVLNLSKFREAAISIRSGFGGQIRGQGKSILRTDGMFSAAPSPIKGDSAGATWKILRPLINYVNEDKDMKNNIKITVSQRGIVITMLSDKLLFDSGRAELREGAYPLLGKIAEILDKVNNDIRVEGHTCDLPPRKSTYPSNWELSTARATNVLRYLVEQKGLNPSQFSAAGYGSVHPAVPNTCNTNRRLNRRVEIVILPPRDVGQIKPSIKPLIKPIVAPDEIRRRPN